MGHCQTPKISPSGTCAKEGELRPKSDTATLSVIPGPGGREVEQGARLEIAEPRARFLEAGDSVEIEVHLRRVEDVERHDVVSGHPQPVERRQDLLGGLVEVGHHRHEAPPSERRPELSERWFQIGGGGPSSSGVRLGWRDGPGQMLEHGLQVPG